jgi:predicted regulator of Ras-like GTPase activity (Roadblock/LC7/MglB family)
MAYEVFESTTTHPIRYHVEELEEQLTELCRYSPVILGALLVSYDGLPLAANLPASVDEERAAARSAAMLVLAERVAAELQRGDLEEICLNGSEGHVVMTTVTADTSLTVLCDAKARLPLVLLEVRYCVARLKALL